MALPSLLDAVERLTSFTRLSNTLPAPRERVTVSGLAGSSDAVLVAAMARRHATRFFVVTAEGLPEAERWLADLESLAEGSGSDVALFPPREGFGEVEPHVEIAGERVETLEKIARGGARILITTARALLERTRLPRALQSARLDLRKGDVRRPADLVAHLEKIGFTRVPMVEDVAQFSLRGGILDVYSFGMTDPARLEFWGDEVVDLRHFDLATQRSTREVASAIVLPVDGRVGESAEDFDRLAVTSLFPPDTVLVLPAGAHIEPELERTWAEAHHHIELARRRGEEAAAREDLFQMPADAQAALEAFGRIALLDPSESAARDADVAFSIRAPEPVDRDIKRLRRMLSTGQPTVILCDNEGQAERLDELLSEGGGPPRAALTIGVLGGGFVIPPADGGPGLRVYTDHEIFRRDRRIRRARRYATAGALETFTALKVGDYVVHLEHGVGIYRGIQQLFVKESTIEVAVIEYEGGDRLNVPLYRIDQIERYRAAEDLGEDAPPPRLHKLGGRKWVQQRERTRAAIEELTVELLDLYARRKIATRPSHVPDTPWQRQLESSFLFEDTPDQRKATGEVKRDMESARPMDRLLVGDVGYGKTEIAVRAAFKAVQSGRQVAVLVPTTILADQHARTFGDRLADFPV
ncbi:MAG: hypothetical protein NVS1B4_17610 [Gemmatimonadaceae bacterium]